VKPTFLYWNFRLLIAWALAVVAFACFGLVDGDFLNPGNIYSLLQSFAPLVIVAFGLGIVMLAGEFDISIAGTLPLAALLSVRLSDSLGTPVAVAVAILVTMAFGMVNGWITATFRIPSLAVTVGSLVLAVGISFAIANGQLVQMKNLAPGLVLTQNVVGIFSLQSLSEIALAIAVIPVIRRSWRGRWLYAVGSDGDRARASGLPVRATLITAFVVSGLFVGVAGALQGVTLASGTAGEDDSFLLQAATAAILGGVSLTGGKGGLVGVFGAALLLAIVSNGLGLVGMNSAAIQLVNGAVLLSVVILDKPLNRLSFRYVQSSTLTDQSQHERTQQREFHV
jgi:ribose transport system permease protein